MAPALMHWAGAELEVISETKELKLRGGICLGLYGQDECDVCMGASAYQREEGA